MAINLTLLHHFNFCKVFPIYLAGFPLLLLLGITRMQGPFLALIVLHA